MGISRIKHILISNRGLLIAALSLCLLVGAGEVQAADGEQVIATIVVASNEGDDFDIVNDVHRDKMLQLFTYKSYKQVDAERVTLSIGKTQTISLPEEYSLSLNLTDIQSDQILVEARVTKGGDEHLNTVVMLPKPSTVFLGGPKTSRGDLILILDRTA